MLLRTYLDENKIKPGAFAASIGKPASTITRILSGRNKPRMDLAQKISDATHGLVRPDDFFGDQAPEHVEAAE